MGLVLVLVLGAAVAAGVLHRQPRSRTTGPSVSPSYQTVDIKGLVVDRTAMDAACGSAPSGVRLGATVDVSDDTGVLLATTTLGQGAASPTGGCQWPFTVSVPAGDRYQVQVAQMKSVTVTSASLVKSAGSAAVTINDEG